MKRILMFLLLGMFFLSFASASISSLETQKQEECVELPQTCPDCTYNNISRVLYPNSTSAVSNVVMQKDDTFYNYTFCDTSSIGIYKVNGYGDVGGTKTSWNYIFEITPNGQDLTTGESIIYFLLALFSFIMFLGMAWFGIGLPFANPRNEFNKVMGIEKLKYAKVGASFLAFAFFVWFVNLLFALSRNLVTLAQFSGFFQMIFQISMALLWPLFVLMIIVFFVLGAKDLKLVDLLTRGFTPNG